MSRAVISSSFAVGIVVVLLREREEEREREGERGGGRERGSEGEREGDREREREREGVREREREREYSRTNVSHVSLLLRVSSPKLHLSAPTHLSSPLLFIRLIKRLKYMYYMYINLFYLRPKSISFGSALGSFDSNIMLGSLMSR